MAAGGKPPGYDLGRRLAAGRAYRDLDQVKAAKRLKVTPATLGRYEEGKIPEVKQRGIIERSTQAFELPEEFFSINLQELPLMAEAWKQVQRLPRPDEFQAIVNRLLEEDPPDA